MTHQQRIELTRGFYATIDPEDFDIISNFKWQVQKRGRTFYAVRRTEKGGHWKMHRLILDCSPGKEVDHIDGNGLNNTRNNLRIVSHRENGQNLHFPKTSLYPGVSWASRDGKWRSYIRLKNGKLKSLGYFNDEQTAGLRYRIALLEEDL